MIVKDYRRDLLDHIIGQRVVIIAHHDVDAVCSVKVLTNLFKSESVTYILLTCYGVSDLKARYAEYSDQSYSFLLINCGVTIDLLQTLSHPPISQKFFVIDHHRPIHVLNYYNTTGQVFVVSSLEDEQVPQFSEIFDIEPEPDATEERKRDYAKWSERREVVLNKYREHCYYARPSCLYALEIAWVMARDDMESIWCTIVGLTDSFVMQRMSRAKYTEFASVLNDHLLSIVNADTLPRACLKVRFTNELNLFLYRNWNIYQSVLATPFVSNTLKTWSKVGISRFHQLLAQIGLPLAEAKRNYLNMNIELKHDLIHMFSTEIVAEIFKLPGLVFGSFVADIGYRPRFNALDMQLATLATLEDTESSKPSVVLFLEAMCILNVHDFTLFQQGVEKAKIMLNLMRNHVQTMIDLGQIHEVGPFVFLQLSETTCFQNYFQKPASIQLLVNNLQHAGIRAHGKRKYKCYPWIVMIPCSYSDFLGVGVQPGAYEYNSRNMFNEVFRVIQIRLQNDVEQDFFDGWVIRIKSTKRQNFIDCLLAISDYPQ